VARYLLVWEDTRTARVRREESNSSAPLAWFRVTWAVAEGNAIYEHAIDRVDVYAHAAIIGARTWLQKRANIPDAIDFCDQLVDGDLAQGESAPDWDRHSVELSRNRSLPH
jgi:hypothetical protein